MILDLNKISQDIAQYKLADSLRYIEKTLLKSENPSGYHALRAEVYLKNFYLEQSLLEIEKSLNFNNNSGFIYNIKGNILTELGFFNDAFQAFCCAIDLEPNIGEFRFNRGQLLLLLGEWGAAIKDYEFRLNSNLFQPPAEIIRYPLWDGKINPDKRILLYWEQGQGDTIHFIRFAQLLTQQGVDVVLEVQDSLVRLLSASFPGIKVVGEKEQLPHVDVRAPIPSLPWLFGITIDTLNSPRAYLHWPSGQEKIAAQLGLPSVGLLWAGNPRHVNDRQRSIPQEELINVAQISGLVFHSLQVNITEKQKRALDRVGVVDLGSSFTDFADTAAAIQALDLVITVDTSVAHLAGALGKPVWILLPFVPDWRWMLNRSDSPWYPSARLFRQPRRGDWASVLKEVKQALVEFRDQRAANSAA